MERIVDVIRNGDGFEWWLWITMLLILVLWGAVNIVAYLDTRRPLTRAERRHLRTMRDGKRAMATDDGREERSV